MKLPLNRIITLPLLLVLSGCAGYAPDNRWIGENQEFVQRMMGAPSSELTLQDSIVMIFPRGPWGKQTYFVYFDPSGAMTRWTQVLDEKNFDLIKPGMHRNEVITIIGESKATYGLARNRGYVWNYRYVNTFCMWFNVEFTSENLVRSTGYSKPPECRIRGQY